ncbi:MAG: Gfo/Idh/MocA family oxidoreductase [Phycisphaeraceae bacterium]
MPKSTRRTFLQTSTAATLTAALPLARVAYAQTSDLLRVGLVGCGGRGTGAAGQALTADSNCKLVALGDAFGDRLEGCLTSLKANKDIADKIDVPKEKRFVGFDAFKKVTDEVDVVLLATPPHFRPLHLKYAIEQNRHVFCEKPVAVDGPGVRDVLKTCELAAKKKLSVVSGLCLRFNNAFGAAVKRLHNGDAGEILTLAANDYRGPIWVKPRTKEQTDMEYQMRNWYYFTWLSGDFNVEQHVHMLDTASWVMKDEYPVKAVGTGGRIVRNTPEFGNIYDHFAITYEYVNGARLFATCRQIRGCSNDIAVYVTGTKGSGQFSSNESRLGFTFDGKPWRYEGPKNNHYQTEHDELFAAIRAGKPINNGEYMCKSTLLAIMGRMAAYTGQQVTWDQAMNSKEDLTPPHYDWNKPLAEPEVARPGVTKFV